MVNSVAMRSLGTSAVRNDRIAEANPFPKLYITITTPVSKMKSGSGLVSGKEDVHVINTGGNGASPMAKVDKERIKTEPLAKAKLAAGAFPLIRTSHALMAGRASRKMKIWVAAWMERR